MYGREGEKSYQNVSGVQTTVLINNSFGDLHKFIHDFDFERLQMQLVSEPARERGKTLQTQLNKWSDRKESNRSFSVFGNNLAKPNDRLAFAAGRKKWCRKATLFRLTEFVWFHRQARRRCDHQICKPARIVVFCLFLCLGSDFDFCLIINNVSMH